MILEALKQMWKDIERNKTIGFMIGISYIIMRWMFHNSCPFVIITGFPCPACGLTRAGILLLQGKVQQACEMHFMIIPFFVLVLSAWIQRYIRKRSLRPLKKYVILLVTAVVFYYIYRMVTQFPGDPPMSFYFDSLFYRAIS